MAKGRAGRTESGDAAVGRAEKTETGGATVEYVGLVALIAALAFVLLAIVAERRSIDEGRRVAAVIGRRLACAPLASDPCRRDPLAVAYGDPLARLVRMLAPGPAELSHQGLVAVDFRYCRRRRCATPRGGEGARLTLSNRRVTAFTELRDRRRSGGGIAVVYWLFRPGQPWQPVRRAAGDTELQAARSVRLGLDESPVLVPLETLPGRNHYRFRAVEQPPWRWRVAPVYPGRPS